jgi:hypothetical protein
MTIQTRGVGVLVRAALPQGVASASLQRWGRPLAVGVTGLLVALAAFLLWTLLTDPRYASLLGNDRAIYVSAVTRWNDGGAFYLPAQVAGPYEIQTGHVMYPPIALPMFELFAWLPPVLYWLVPLLTIALVTAYHRPAWWAWPLIAACVAYPWTGMLVVAGNPTLWVTAAVAAGTLLGWPAVLVALKPSLVPFALIGVRRRSWWVAGAALLVMAAAFGSLWIDWVHVVINARGWRSGPLYSLSDVPLLAIPVIAWMAGRFRRPEARGPRPQTPGGHRHPDDEGILAVERVR